MKKLFSVLMLLLVSSCGDQSIKKKAEIEAFKTILTSIEGSQSKKSFINVRKIISRDWIDQAKVPILFVELPSGQNGTLTLYPGEGYGKTWIGQDGATLTLERGVLKASRGMGSDLMGSSNGLPNWGDIINGSTYTKKLFLLEQDNRINVENYLCSMIIKEKIQEIDIFDVNFQTRVFEEKCESNSKILENLYFLDTENIVRRSQQYHSANIGYILTERIDR